MIFNITDELDMPTCFSMGMAFPAPSLTSLLAYTSSTLTTLLLLASTVPLVNPIVKHKSTLCTKGEAKSICVPQVKESSAPGIWCSLLEGVLITTIVRFRKGSEKKQSQSQKHNRPKALSTLTHSTPSSQSRSFIKL